VPRPQNPLNADGGPLAKFALELRALRDGCGSAAATIDDIADREKIPRSTLYAALSGKRVPTRDVLAALVKHWNGDDAEWMARRSAAEAAMTVVRRSRPAPAHPTSQHAAGPQRKSSEWVAQFAARLRELHKEVGSPSYEQLSRYSDMQGSRLPKSTIHNLLNGGGMPRWATVESFIQACQAVARRRGPSTRPERTDLDRWRHMYESIESPTRGRLSE
jgi:AcrR family transcriptional regulator